MSTSFWENLPRPFFALAPMSKITDPPMRRIMAKYGKPDVIFTEFVSVAGLCSRGRERLLPDLGFHKSEHPVVAQFFGREPEHFFECARLAAELGFDGIDINMGCPDKSVLKQGAGSGLIQEPHLAAEIVRAAKEGGNGLPVSVKTRIGYQDNETEKWIPEILAMRPAALSLHGRTRKQKYKGRADWESIRRAAAMAREAGIPILGNGDILTRAQGEEYAAEYKVDGIMIGRAVLGNPWIFNREIEKKDLTPAEVLKVMLEHARVFEEYYGERCKFRDMRKHFTQYITDFFGAKRLRHTLCQTENSDEVASFIEKYLNGEL